MKKYEVISLDVFQTLVDVNKRIPEIWQGILGDEYTKEKAQIGANAVFKHIPDTYIKAISSEEFINMEEFYNIISKKVIEDTKFNVDIKTITYNVLLQHGLSPFFDEVKECLDYLNKRYKVIVSSDSNDLMVGNILKSINYSEAFISDDLGCYKGDIQGRFFKKVLSKLDVSPDKIIHIGDSSLDIVGSHNAGITSCWLNRNHRECTYAVKPDYIIHDLKELNSILED